MPTLVLGPFQIYDAVQSDQPSSGPAAKLTTLMALACNCLDEAMQCQGRLSA